MDTSKFKNTVQKLSFFKDYSSLLTSVVIAAAALLVFVLAVLMGNRLRGEMLKTSVSAGNKIMALSKTVVPSGQWRVEQAYQQAHGRDANETALLAKQATQRELLSYKLFPEPNESSTLIVDEFGRRFCSALEELFVRVNARDCPTEAELDRHWGVLGYQGNRGTGGQRAHGKSRRSELSEVEAAITDALCREKAESASVYANVADLAGYEFWRESRWKSGYSGMKQVVKDCWYWQLGYWITEDVIDTISMLDIGYSILDENQTARIKQRESNSENRESSNVFTSPVKRLLAVSFGSGERSGGSTKAKGKGGESAAGGLGRETAYNEPSYVRTTSDGLTMPYTARICNDALDVVHFRVSVIVDSKEVFSFMSQLCSGREHKFRGYYGRGEPQVFKHNQITILSGNIESIDAEDEMHKLYRYGEAAVVRLDLICEYIFKKDGYDEIKPGTIKEKEEPQER